MKTRVTSRGQTVIPARIRRDHGIDGSTKLEWIDDGETIRVVPLPRDPVQTAKKASAGLTRHLIARRDRERFDD